MIEQRARLITKPPGTPLYEVVYGSWAHGTQTPTSDYDWRGVYLLPTDDFLGLGRPKLNWEDRTNDRVFWELGLFCNLLIKGNPNIVGMLFVPTDVTITQSPIMGRLLDDKIRRGLLSNRLRGAYMGWIHRELKDIGKLHKGSAKRLSHVLRLIWEIGTVLTEHWFVVRPPAEKVEQIVAVKTGAMPYEDAVAYIGEQLLALEAVDEAVGHKLLGPPIDEIESWLLYVRRAHG